MRSSSSDFQIVVTNSHVSLFTILVLNLTNLKFINTPEPLLRRILGELGARVTFLVTEPLLTLPLDEVIRFGIVGSIVEVGDKSVMKI